MTSKQRDLFNNIGKPNYALLNSVYDLTEEDIVILLQKDLEMLNTYYDWKNHKDRKLLIVIISDWFKMYKITN